MQLLYHIDIDTLEAVLMQQNDVMFNIALAKTGNIGLTSYTVRPFIANSTLSQQHDISGKHRSICQRSICNWKNQEM